MIIFLLVIVCVFSSTVECAVSGVEYLILFKGGERNRVQPLIFEGINLVIKLDRVVSRVEFKTKIDQLSTFLDGRGIAEEFDFDDFYQYEDGYHWIVKSFSIESDIQPGLSYWRFDGVEVEVSFNELIDMDCLGSKNEVESKEKIILERTIENSGFHRLMKTKLTFPQPVDVSNVVLFDVLPRSIYVDEFELEKYFQELEFNVRNFRRVDIEKPKILGEPVHIEVGLRGNEGSQKEVEFSYPIHVRYHPPGSKTHENVLLNPPTVLFRKQGNEGEDSFFKCAIGMEVSSFPKYLVDQGWEFLKHEQVGEVNIDIPIGLVEKKDFVTYTTLTVTTLSTIVLVVLVLLSRR